MWWRLCRWRFHFEDDSVKESLILAFVPTILDPLSGDLLYKRTFLIDPSRMDRNKDKMVERILHLTLEILFRLTGEDYTLVKKTSSEHCQDPVSEGWGRPLSPIRGPPPHPLIHEDINDQKILELTYKMTELLTGEVPIRCQDVTVYFSMEEWEYLEGHKDMYKDVMMEVPQPLTSPVLSCERTTPERCHLPLLPQDCKQEDPDVPQDHQGKDLPHINTTETYVMGEEQCKEEIPTDNYTDDCTRSSKEYMIFPDVKADDCSITPDAYEDEEYAITQDIPQAFYSIDVSSDPLQQVLSTDSSQTFKQNKNNQRDGKHQRDQARKKPFSCSECGKCFTDKSTLGTHQRIHTGEKPFSCSECGKCFTQKTNLVTHQRIHTGEKLFSCSFCGKCCSRKSNLVKHQRIHTEKKIFSCSECGKSFNQISKLVTHQRSHTGEKPFSCSECGKCFNQKIHLVTHQRSHTGEKPFSCSECGKCFAKKSTLIRHQRIHTGEKLFSCPECGKFCSQKSDLDNHRKTHTGNKQFLCSVCGKCFYQKTNLIAHLRIHSGENAFSCTECGKYFPNKSYLVTHQRVHTGEKPFSCSQCGKKFTVKSNLVTHQRVHTGEKPFSCTQCGKYFTAKSNLDKHLRSHTGEKPFSCSQCGKYFTSKSNLLRHQIIHT
ncbi:uncharacterized protein [Phyllobates terribilis]|uniref:uncharacterized protein isoform X1 n=3 Tax=Phyllobates terribilis TaxID=111132 RepID=UPI003CCB68D6